MTNTYSIFEFSSASIYRSCRHIDRTKDMWWLKQSSHIENTANYGVLQRQSFYTGLRSVRHSPPTFINSWCYIIFMHLFSNNFTVQQSLEWCQQWHVSNGQGFVNFGCQGHLNFVCQVWVHILLVPVIYYSWHGLKAVIDYFWKW